MQNIVRNWRGLLVLALVLSGSATAQAQEGMRAQYKEGDGLKIGDGNNLVHIQGRVQGRFTYNNLEGAADNDTWAIQRGKIKIEGFTLQKKLKFGFQMNLATRSRASTATVCTNAGCTSTASAVTTESTTGLATLEDFYVDYVPVDYWGIKVGQFKVPFLMQELTSSGKQQFVDRSSSTAFFNFARDIGATFHGNLFEDKLRYDVFFMNGDGINTINRNQGLLIGTRLEVPVIGNYTTSESDTDHSEDHNFGFGVGYAINDAVGSLQSGTVAAGLRASHGTLDMGYKYKGLSFQGAGMITRTHEGARLTNWGYNTQVGYFLIPKLIEVAARGAGTIFTNAVVNQYEYAGALNYFIRGHGLKIQTDYALLLNTRGANLNDHRIRTQLQLVF